MISNIVNFDKILEVFLKFWKMLQNFWKIQSWEPEFSRTFVWNIDETFGA